MATVEVSDSTAVELGLLARAWKVTLGEAVERVLDEFKTGSTTAGSAHEQSSSELVAVHAQYQGVRVEAQYDPRSSSLKVTAGPAAGRRFKSPSAAAIAVVSELNPHVHPNRNGWSFWTITATGKRLQSIRREAVR